NATATRTPRYCVAMLPATAVEDGPDIVTVARTLRLVPGNRGQRPLDTADVPPPVVSHSVWVPAWSVSTACQVVPPSVDISASMASPLAVVRLFRPPVTVRSMLSVTDVSVSGAVAGPNVCAPTVRVVSGIVRVTGMSVQAPQVHL